MKLNDIYSNVKRGFLANSPAILTGFGIAGMISATVMAVLATPKALDKIAEIKEQVPEDDKKEFAKEVVTKVAPLYLPTVATTGFSVACLICAQNVNSKRTAAFATAYSLSESALKEYQAKVVETIGEKKEQKIRDEIAADTIARNPVVNNEIIITGKGDVLCYESLSGRYFTSDIETLRKIENYLNKRLLTEMFISNNELYYELGLKSVKNGDSLGFDINDGLIEFSFSYAAADDGRPCLVLGYHLAPKYRRKYGDFD